MPGSPSPGVDAAEVEERLVGEAEPPRELAERLQELLRRVALVAGLERRVRREDDVPAHPLERLLERRPLLDVERGALERRQRRMALVQVHDVGMDVERLEHARAADPEQPVLREPDVRVAVVGARRRPPAHRVVLGQLRVEQEQRHAPDLDAPDLEGDRAAEERDRQAQRLAVRPVDEGHRQLGGIVVEPVLLLRPGDVEPLDEVAAPVEEPDADHGEAAVARLLEHVAGQHAEAARVARQRRVHAELGREVGDRAVEHGARRAAAGGRRVELVGEPVHPLHDVRVLRDDELAVVVQLEEEPDRVAGGEPPAVRVDLREDEPAAADPAPAQVVGDAGERLQLVDEPPLELGDALGAIAPAEGHVGVSVTATT